MKKTRWRGVDIKYSILYSRFRHRKTTSSYVFFNSKKGCVLSVCTLHFRDRFILHLFRPIYIPAISPIIVESTGWTGRPDRHGLPGQRRPAGRPGGTRFRIRGDCFCTNACGRGCRSSSVHERDSCLAPSCRREQGRVASVLFRSGFQGTS